MSQEILDKLYELGIDSQSADLYTEILDNWDSLSSPLKEDIVNSIMRDEETNLTLDMKLHQEEYASLESEELQWIF